MRLVADEHRHAVGHVQFVEYVLQSDVDDHHRAILVVDHTKEHPTLPNNTYAPMMPMLMTSSSNGTTMQQYYHAPAPPFFHFNMPSQPVWQQYFSATNSYPVSDTETSSEKISTRLFVVN